MSAQAIAQTHLDAPNLFRPNDRDLEILPIRSYSQLSVATSYSHYQHIYTLSRCRTIVHSTSRQSNNICTRTEPTECTRTTAQGWHARARRSILGLLCLPPNADTWHLRSPTFCIISQAALTARADALCPPPPEPTTKHADRL